MENVSGADAGASKGASGICYNQGHLGALLSKAWGWGLAAYFINLPSRI